MGTNYYAVTKKSNFSEYEISILSCDEPIKHEDDELIIHLGKSSGGWRFSLHVYPEIGIMNWEDVQNIAYYSNIYNEYGDEVPYVEFCSIVMDRSWERLDFPMKVYIDNKTPERFKVTGTNSLGDYTIVKNIDQYQEATGYTLDKKGNIIHPIDGIHCIGNGRDTDNECQTFDYIIGHFS